MPAKKPQRREPQPASPTPEMPVTSAAGRKPWKKKTPVEVFLAQEEKLRYEVEQAEQELEQKKSQLRKFQEARRIFEST